MTEDGFIPFELRVRKCRTPTKNCNGQTHMYTVQPTSDPYPHVEELCAWHGQAWPRADAPRPADEARRKARQRRAIQEAQGFGQMSKLGQGRREVSSET
jgi:hypothetical protein